MTTDSLLSSARAYTDEEFAALIENLSLTDPAVGPSSSETPTVVTPIPPPELPSYSPPASPTTPVHSTAGDPLYYYESPTKSGYTTSWATAGAATQGVPRAHVHSVRKRNRQNKPTPKAYAVFFGRTPGVFLTWAETQRSVSGISGHIFRGYQSVAAAQAAFSYARSRSWTRAASATSSQTPLLSLPKPISESDEVEVNPLHDTESLDDTWYVVYSGISPGVYRSILEALLNTVGIRGQLYESVVGREEAFRRFRSAQGQGETSVVPPPSYDSTSDR